MSNSQHPITIEPEPRVVTVTYRGAVIASTDRALSLRESSYPPVLYVPREHVAMAFLAPSEKRTTCPHKGEASYWTIQAEASSAENAVWSYESPKPGVEAIAGHLAFYPDKVNITTAERGGTATN